MGARVKARAAARTGLTAIVEALSGPDSPIGDPRPLGPSGLAACEKQAGVALSPAMAALLQLDRGWIGRTYGWFDARGELASVPMIELLAEHAGPHLREAFEPICAARFPGRALPLDRGCDSMRLLYLGDPDPCGEYPVLCVDVDDLPLLCVESPGFDGWLAAQLGLPRPTKRAISLANQRLFGSDDGWELGLDDADLPPPADGPPPGSVDHPPLRVPGVPLPELGDDKLERALCERATDRDDLRLDELLGEAARRGWPPARLGPPLVSAAIAGHDPVIARLLAAGAPPDAEDGYGCALARLCCHSADAADPLAVADRLLAAGADPNGPSVNGKTVLHEAVEAGHVGLVQRLLAAGADPNREDDAGMTALCGGCQQGIPVELVDALIDGGADPNAGSNHSSALHWAIEARNAGVVDRLLARGADVNAVSGYQRRRPLHAAFEVADDALAARLIRAGADRSATDARKIRLDDVYGPGGEDIRRIEVRYAPSAEVHELELEVTFALLNLDAGTSSAAFAAGAWAEYVRDGFASGSAFDPTAASASPTASIELAAPSSRRASGRATGRLVLEVAGISPVFVGIIASAALGGAMAFTGAGLHAATRGVALSVRGSAPGPSAIDAPTLRKWLAAPPRLGRWPVPPPFPVEVGPLDDPDDPPSVVFTTRRKPTNKARERIGAFMARWLDVASIWPSDPAQPSAMLAVPMTTPGDKDVAIELASLLDGPAKVPFDWPSAEDLLHNGLHVLHRDVPLERVTVRLPAD